MKLDYWRAKAKEQADEIAALQAETATQKKIIIEREAENLAFSQEINLLQEELAALTAELQRAREALIGVWAYLYHHGGQRHAEARYACEIAQVCTYPDCSCMFDMGADNKCWQGYKREIAQEDAK